MGQFHRSVKGKPGLPIQLDVRKEEDRAWLALHNIMVMVDGARQIGVVAFNTSAGKLTRFVTENGKPVFEDGEAKVETIRCNVAVEWTP